MSFNSAGSFDHLDSSAQPFGDGYIGFDSTHQFGSSPNFADPIAESTVDESSIFTSQQPITESLYSPPSINTPTAEFAVDPAEFNSVTNGPILPEMIAEEGDALKLWRRENAARLEEKELLQKHLMEQILEEADVYKIEFHKKRQAASETNKVLNREKEKVFLASLEKFHVEADKDYWKSIAELVPKEVPVLEKKGKGNKPSISIMQGPKPGKPTDLSRMRQTLVKLKHDTPAHLKPLFHVTSNATVDDVAVDPIADVEISGQPIAAV